MSRRSHQLALFLAALISLTVSACDPRGLGLPNPDFLVIGHRGAPNIVAENTISSFVVAAALGANAIETDVCVTKDDQLVLWHDYDPDDAIAVARQSGAEGLGFIPLVPAVVSSWRRPVDELTLSELREHYGYGNIWGQRDETATIPTFNEALDWMRSEPTLRAMYLDVKFPSGQTAAARALVATVWNAWQADATLAHVRFYFLSVHRDIVDAMEAERVSLDAVTLRTVWDFEGLGALDATLEAGLRDISTGLVPSVTWARFKREVAELVNAREDGRIDSVTVWTFDREMHLTELLYYSVDGVMTNEPRALYRIWQDALN
ncbi:MAG: glycerophosphodiester phosphodiesterase [Polyangiaceae bacterium]